MKNVAIIVFVLLSVSLSGQDNSIKNKPMLKQKITFCSNDTLDYASKRIYDYDSIGNLIKLEHYVRKEGLIERTLNYYNSLGQLDYYEFYRTNYRDSMFLSHTDKKIYDSNNNLIGVKRISNNVEEWRPVEKHDTIYIKTKKGILKKTSDCEFYCDSLGRILKTITINGTIAKYKYLNSRLVSINIKSNQLFNHLSKRLLFYYDEDRLVKKYTEYYDTYSFHIFPKKLGNFESIEYSYAKGLIMEVRTRDHGFDPCCHACCGNFIIKYKYEE